MKTNFSTPYFGKPFDALTYQDIEAYFAEAQEESTRIEFKGFSTRYGNLNKNLEGVIRGICAMLNSEGGIVIWGGPIGAKNEEGKEVFQGALSPVNELKEKDWIINKVSDSITPLPIGIEVRILTKGEKHLYVFEVQQSNYSPHQFKNIYYARLDGQTKPAPHYLIDSLFNKVTYPNIEAYIRFGPLAIRGDDYILNITIGVFNQSPLINEENVNYRIVCPMALFQNFHNPNSYAEFSMGGHQLIYNNKITQIHYGTPYTHSEIMIIKPNEILNSNNEVTFIMSFGGKKSPHKISKYTLNFDKLDLRKTENVNYLIENCLLNTTSFEGVDNLGAHNKEVIDDFLNNNLPRTDI